MRKFALQSKRRISRHLQKELVKKESMRLLSEELRPAHDSNAHEKIVSSIHIVVGGIMDIVNPPDAHCPGDGSYGHFPRKYRSAIYSNSRWISGVWLSYTKSRLVGKNPTLAIVLRISVIVLIGRKS